MSIRRYDTLTLGLLKIEEEEEEEERRLPNRDFFTSHGAYVKLRYNYSDVIHSFDWKSALKHDVGV